MGFGCWSLLGSFKSTRARHFHQKLHGVLCQHPRTAQSHRRYWKYGHISFSSLISWGKQSRWLLSDCIFGTFFFCLDVRYQKYDISNLNRFERRTNILKQNTLAWQDASCFNDGKNHKHLRLLQGRTKKWCKDMKAQISWLSYSCIEKLPLRVCTILPVPGKTKTIWPN